MTVANRPPLARQHTRTSKARQDSELDQGYKLTVDGEVFEARVGDVTPQIARELRAHTGMGFMSLMGALAQDPDIDLVSAAVWVARAIRGERVGFLDVEVNYAQILSDDFGVAAAGAEDLGDAPPEG